MTNKQKRNRTAAIIMFLLLATVAAAEPRSLPVISQDIPLTVKLKVGATTGFMVPADVQNIAIPGGKAETRLLVQTSPKTMNIFYLTPKSEIRTPLNFFCEAGSNIYEFAITAARDDDYRHLVIVGKDPVTSAVEQVRQSLMEKHQAELTELTGGIDSLVSSVKRAKKIKPINRVIFRDGLTRVTFEAQIGDIALLQSNAPRVAFGKSLPDAVWVNNYVLTRCKKFSVDGKEVSL